VYLEAYAAGVSYTWQHTNEQLCSNCSNAIFFVPQQLKANITATISNNGLCNKTCNYEIITKGIPVAIVLLWYFRPTPTRQIMASEYLTRHTTEK